MKRVKRSMQYDHLMGTPMDANKHPINNLPTPIGTTSPSGTGILGPATLGQMAPGNLLGPSGEEA